MFGMFTGVVLSNLKVIDLSSSRNLAIIGTAIFAGLMVPYWIETFPKELQTGMS
jgi:xanthine/uracil permease